MKNFLLILLSFFSFTTFAQKQFVVQGVTTQTFDDINAAIAAANAGDTIYLPGGGFSLNPTTIDKTLHWRGVGHYPDSTTATGYTNITNSDIYFTTNCDSSTFEGIYFTGNLRFGTVTNEEVSGVIIKRCRVAGTIFLRKDANTNLGNPDLGFQLSESVVVTIGGQKGRNCLIENNLIFGNCDYFYYSIFDHNMFNYSSVLLDYSINCRYINNVFAWSTPNLSGSSNCEFLNNLFASTLPYNPTTQTFTGNNNITNIGNANIYTAITGYIYTFSYDNDYHLKTDATGTSEDGTTGVTIIGAASDGTNPGIYGGTMPYKDGAVPYAPHIRTADIDNAAVSGNLGVQITVAAQER